MGLDSVELMMEIENYFGISIPDSEAEKAETVQQVVDTIAKHLNVTNNDNELRDKMLERINQAMLELQFISIPVTPADYISKYLFTDKEASWEAFTNKLQLYIPKPDILNRDSKKLKNKIKVVMNWKPRYDWFSITIDQFIAAVCASNHEALIDRKKITSTYEIYIVVTAITVDKIAIDYYEVAPEKSFTMDLGVD